MTWKLLTGQEQNKEALELGNNKHSLHKFYFRCKVDSRLSEYYIFVSVYFWQEDICYKLWLIKVKTARRLLVIIIGVFY